MSKKTVVVLGVDGYLGWATALHLSQAGHDVVGIDSLVRRRWDRECGTQSLIPIKPMKQRVDLWHRLTGRTISWRKMDLRDARAVTALVKETQPDALIHFAEQRSAPFSMIDLPHASLTQVNNLVGTLNLLFALRDQALVARGFLFSSPESPNISYVRSPAAWSRCRRPDLRSVLAHPALLIAFNDGATIP